MKKFLNSFFKSESGAITVDWVVLAAALVLLGFLVMFFVGGAAESHGLWLQDTMEGRVTD